jgi:hypothetical protein
MLDDAQPWQVAAGRGAGGWVGMAVWREGRRASSRRRAPPHWAAAAPPRLPQPSQEKTPPPGVRTIVGVRVDAHVSRVKLHDAADGKLGAVLGGRVGVGVGVGRGGGCFGFVGRARGALLPWTRAPFPAHLAADERARLAKDIAWSAAVSGGAGRRSSGVSRQAAPAPPPGHFMLPGCLCALQPSPHRCRRCT